MIFLLFLAFGIAMADDGASAAHFSSIRQAGSIQAGGVVGDNVVYLYWDNDAAKIDDTKTLDSMAQQAKRQVCASADSRMILEKLKKQILFIYPDKTNNSFTIITITKCN